MSKQWGLTSSVKRILSDASCKAASCKAKNCEENCLAHSWVSICSTICVGSESIQLEPRLFTTLHHKQTVTWIFHAEVQTIPYTSQTVSFCQSSERQAIQPAFNTRAILKACIFTLKRKRHSRSSRVAAQHQNQTGAPGFLKIMQFHSKTKMRFTVFLKDRSSTTKSKFCLRST